MINLNKIFELSLNHMIKYLSYTFILFNIHNYLIYTKLQNIIIRMYDISTYKAS
jgi:hypothetical protein